MRSAARAFVVLLILFSATEALAATSRTTLPGGGVLDLVLPDGWRAATEISGPGLTVRITAASADFVVLITALPVRAGSTVKSADDVRNLVIQQGTAALASALQEKLEMSEVRSEGGVAFLYHLTDRSPERGPGDYREANQGAMLLGRYLLTITILTHPGDDAIVAQAKGLLASAQVAD